MLESEKRLKNSRDFKRVYQKGSFFSVHLFSLNSLLNRSSFTRVGIVVNKKVAKKAVDRNRVKRQFREATRHFYGVLPKGYDVIITIKAPALAATFQEIERAVKGAFERVGKAPKK